MQCWQRPVTLGNHALCSVRPDDGEIGIIPADAARSLLAIGFRDMVDDFGVIGQSLKTMGKSCGDVQRCPIVGGQLDPDPFGACGGSRPQVDHHVEYRPSGATDELDLFIWGSLEVEAAQRAAMVIERDAPLRVMCAKPSLHEQIAAERTRKKASIIFQLLELDDQRATDSQWGK